METPPAFAKINALDLSISIVQFGDRRPLLNTRVVGAGLTELWRGTVSWATLNRENALALVAWLEQQDGRAGVWLLPLATGFATTNNAISTTLSAAAATGADTIALTGQPAVSAGTLLSVGSVGSTSHQIVECLQSVAVGAGPIRIAPRLRNALASGTTVTGGSVTMAVRLASDTPSASLTYDRGNLSATFVEAL